MAKELNKRRSGKVNPAVKIATEAAFTPEGKPSPVVGNALLRAVEVQRPLVLANLRRLRRKHPHATPGELSAKLERDFLSAVTGGGAAIGATAIIPGVGTVVSLSISAAATVVFLETTALYAQSVAELHGVRLADPERSSAMVMAIILGEEGTSMVQGLTGHVLGQGKTPMNAWGSAVGKSLPAAAVKSLGGRLQKAFLRRLMLREGSALVGRAIPFGIGAVIGGGGNLIMGRAVAKSTKLAFGPAPEVWPGGLLAELGPQGSPEPAGRSLASRLIPGRPKLDRPRLDQDQLDKLADTRKRPLRGSLPGRRTRGR